MSVVIQFTPSYHVPSHTLGAQYIAADIYSSIHSIAADKAKKSRSDQPRCLWIELILNEMMEGDNSSQILWPMTHSKMWLLYNSHTLQLPKTKLSICRYMHIRKAFGSAITSLVCAVLWIKQFCQDRSNILFCTMK